MTSEAKWSDPEMKALEELDIFKRPLCLISSDKEGMLSIQEETMSQLEQIQRGVNVVAIAGLYRTGKSYLMNRLAHVSSGFALGNTTNSKTKGIWVWCKDHPTQRHQILVLLDTEGLGDILKGNTDHDNRIFTLAALLSSTLVYNMMGAFNQDSIEKLTFITEMSKHMKIGGGMSNDNNFDFVLPRFVLCLRDFFLETEDDKDKPITPDEYLEVCLRSRKTTSPEDEKYNRPRECIKKYFTRRKVFTFDIPGGKRVMSKLEETHDDKLSQDFVEDTVKFTSFIFQCEPKMLVNRQHVTGSMLANLAREYVNAMRGEGIPCVDDALTTMSKIENEKSVKKAVADFDEKMKTLKLPIHSNKEFLEAKFKFQKSVLISLNKCLVFDDKNEAEKSAEELREKEEMAEKRFKDSQDALLQQIKEQREAHEKEMERNREEQRKREEASMLEARNELLKARGISENSKAMDDLRRENERLKTESNRGVFTKAWDFLFR